MSRLELFEWHWPRSNDIGISFQTLYVRKNKFILSLFAVPVTLVTSTTTTEAPMIESETSSTSIKLATSDANDETHGCHIDGEYYQDGMQVRWSFRSSPQIDCY